MNVTAPGAQGVSPSYDGYPLLIGADIDNGGLSQAFHGVIDDVRIFSTARTARQIAQDMAGCSPVGDPTLIAYYNFDEGIGLVAHDSSPNHLDGTLGSPDAGGAAPAWVVSTAPF